LKISGPMPLKFLPLSHVPRQQKAYSLLLLSVCCSDLGSHRIQIHGLKGTGSSSYESRLVRFNLKFNVTFLKINQLFLKPFLIEELFSFPPSL
jgi:hypothetical protein